MDAEFMSVKERGEVSQLLDGGYLVYKKSREDRSLKYFE